MPSKPGKCHIRFAEPTDWPELERIYIAHEGGRIPAGYFSEYRECLRNPDTLYFVASVGDRVVGGGGIAPYQSGEHATLAFGLVDPQECCKGYGTALLLARLLYVDTGASGCRIFLTATFWSNPFYARVGFRWYGNQVDEAGNRLLYGSLLVRAGEQDEFRTRLEDSGVTLGFGLDRPEIPPES